MLATRYRTKKSFLDGFTSLHIFVVTLRCNHTCHYCQVSRQTEDKGEFDMATDDLDRSIDLMFRSPSPALTMEFQGGEPLLAFDQGAVRNRARAPHQRDRAAAAHVRRLHQRDRLLGRGAGLLCRARRTGLDIARRPRPTFTTPNRAKSGADSHAPRLRGNCGQPARHSATTASRALMTTTARSLGYPIEIVDTYVEMGFDHIFLRPISPYGFAVRSRAKNDYDTRRFLDFYKAGLDARA